MLPKTEPLEQLQQDHYRPYDLAVAYECGVKASKGIQSIESNHRK